MMEIRNVRYNEAGTIDCEIEHPQYGWIPFTASPHDSEPHGREIYNAALEMGPLEYSPPPTPTQEELLAEERATMVCSVRQARIVLGPEVCALLDAMVDDPAYPWALRQTLKYATTWERNRPEIDEIGWALNYTPEQIDDLFRQAMLV